jgi:hypothetical protein
MTENISNTASQADILSHYRDLAIHESDSLSKAAANALVSVEKALAHVTKASSAIDQIVADMDHREKVAASALRPRKTAIKQIAASYAPADVATQYLELSGNAAVEARAAILAAGAQITHTPEEVGAFDRRYQGNSPFYGTPIFTRALDMGIPVREYSLLLAEWYSNQPASVIAEPAANPLVSPNIIAGKSPLKPGETKQGFFARLLRRKGGQ